MDKANMSMAIGYCYVNLPVVFLVMVEIFTQDIPETGGGSGGGFLQKGLPCTNQYTESLNQRHLFSGSFQLPFGKR